MNYYVFFPFATFLINFFTCTYILALRRKRSVNGAYVIFASFFAVWSLLKIIAWALVDTPFALPFIRGFSFIWIFIGCTFMNFTYHFINKKKDGPYYGFFLLSIISYIITATTNLVIADYTKYYWGLFEVWGTLFSIAAASFILPFLYSFGLILSRWRQ